MRVVSFDEIEAWLHELPWWEEELKEAGAAPSCSITGTAGIQGGTAGSPTEREGMYLAELSSRVDLLRSVIRDMPVQWQEFIQVRYLARTATMGHSMRQTCALLDLTRSQYYRLREQVLGRILAEIYIRGLDPGQPYSYCHQELVPKELRSSS